MPYKLPYKNGSCMFYVPIVHIGIQLPAIIEKESWQTKCNRSFLLAVFSSQKKVSALRCEKVDELKTSTDVHVKKKNIFDM